MNLISIKFPENVSNSFKITWAFKVRTGALAWLNIYRSKYDNSYRTAKSLKLEETQTYINDVYKTNINIYKVIQLILKNIKLNHNCTALCIDDTLKFENMSLINLYQIITFGTSLSPKNEVIKECLTQGISWARKTI